MSIPNEPIGRHETYLAKMAGQNVSLPPEPIGREEEYLDYIARTGGGGGGGGVTDYDDLFHRPSINGNTLTGNQTGAQLGLVDKVNGKGLSSNDYTDEEKTKLEGIASGAEANVQSDWNQTETDADDYIKNKPTIPSVAANPSSTTETLTGIEIDGVGYAVSGGGSGAVTSVNSKTGAVVLDASDVGALPNDTPLFSGDYDDLTDKPTLGTAAAKDSTNAVTQNSTDLVESGAVYTALTNKISKSETAGLVKNDGTIDTNTYLTQHQDISGKADKSEMSVTAGTGADADKTTIQLKSGTSATVLTTHQSITGKADKVSGATNGNFAGLDSNGNLTDSGSKASDFAMNNSSESIAISNAGWVTIAKTIEDDEVNGTHPRPFDIFIGTHYNVNPPTSIIITVMPSYMNYVTFDVKDVYGYDGDVITKIRIIYNSLHTIAYIQVYAALQNNAMDVRIIGNDNWIVGDYSQDDLTGFTTRGQEVNIVETFQRKTLSSPINIHGSSRTTVESALTGLNDGLNEKADQTLIAPIEATATASQAHSVRELFVYNGVLYKATTAISQGDTITVNGNCESTNLNDESYRYEMQAITAKAPQYVTIYQNDWYTQSYYIIKNGICYVSINIKIASEFTGNLVICDLPEGILSTFAIPGLIDFEGSSVISGLLYQTGKLYLRGNGLPVNNKIYSISFSYPIK